MRRFAAVSLFVIGGAFGVARAQAPDAMVMCRDGMTSASGAGGCASHGGVVAAQTAAGPEQRSSPAIPEPAQRKQAGGGTEAFIKCNDGNMVTPGENACARNGGIAVAAPAPLQATRTKPSMHNPKAELNTPGPTPEAAGNAPTALCNDGALSYATSYQEACTEHGGVATWYDNHK